MTDLETQVRAALDQLAASVKYHCGPLPCQHSEATIACENEHLERLLAAWSQATARAAHKLAKEFAEENVNEFGCGTPEEIVAVTTSNESEFVAALREGEAP